MPEQAGSLPAGSRAGPGPIIPCLPRWRVYPVPSMSWFFLALGRSPARTRCGRARTCCGHRHRAAPRDGCRSSPLAVPDRAFTVGLFSVVDALLGKPMQALLDELPFDSRITHALLDHDGPEGRLLAAVLAYERGDFNDAPPF